MRITRFSGTRRPTGDNFTNYTFSLRNKRPFKVYYSHSKNDKGSRAPAWRLRSAGGWCRASEAPSVSQGKRFAALSIASRIIFLFLSLGLIIASIATGYVTQKNYQVTLDGIVEQAVERTNFRPDLQFAFYKQDKDLLQSLLDDLLKTDNVIQAIAYSGIGDELVARGGAGSKPLLSTVRSGSSVTDRRLVAVSGERNTGGTGFWSALISGDSNLYLSIPVFSPLTPTRSSLDLADFIVAHSGEEPNSRVVLGFLNLTIDRSALLSHVMPDAVMIFGGSILLLFLCTAPALLYTRQLTVPISQLNEAAAQFLSGERKETIDVDAQGEFRDLAQVFNDAVKRTGAKEETTELEHKLLLMQAGERATKLEEQEEELSRATDEINATKEELHRLANYDELTSLPNRQLFTEQLGLLLRMCERDGNPVAVLLLNIDNFNRINDSLGRAAGEQLLKEVGERLLGSLRGSDVLALNVDAPDNVNVSRLSGDEFAMALGQMEDVTSADVVAQRVVQQLMLPISIDNHELVLVPKVGISLAPRHGTDGEELLRLAAHAMHRARSLTGGAYLVYDTDDMQDTGKADLRMEAELRKAIERDQLSLHYQPQVDITSGAIVCAEAFLRWKHPDFGEVPPSRFIQLAEETGQMWELGDWVIAEACRQLREFEDLGIQLPRVAVNVSPEQIQPAFVSRLGEILEQSGLRPSKLELGLSEAVLMNNDESTLKFLLQLKELGVYLSLENFGASHAPMNYLSRYPLDEMKIDRSFVADCDKRQSASRLARAIIAMSESLELPPVAEGVETEGEFRFLSDQGVIKMRGYLFSKPVPAEELKSLLAVPWHYMEQIQKMAMLAELAAPGNS